MEKELCFYCIVNPEGGGGRALKAWRLLKAELEKQNVPFDYILTKAKGDGIEVALNAIDAGYEHLIAVGGDGTANEVANGILQKQAADNNLSLSLSLFSCGTGNDWVKAHNIPRDAASFVNNLNNLKYSIQDVGKVDFVENNKASSRYLINVAGLAYDAYVASKSEGQKKGFWAGKLYLFQIFKLLFSYKPEKASIVTDEEEWEDTVYTINVGKCKYSGGNMQLVPHAKPDDGMLAVTIASSLPKWEVILQTPRFYNGNIGKHPKIRTFHSKTIQIASLEDKAILLEIDGEFVGNTPVKIEVMEKALKVFGF